MPVLSHSVALPHNCMQRNEVLHAACSPPTDAAIRYNPHTVKECQMRNHDER
jgi:hypothetical protein